jgi:hypothetical protein
MVTSPFAMISLIGRGSRLFCGYTMHASNLAAVALLLGLVVAACGGGGLSPDDLEQQMYESLRSRTIRTPPRCEKAVGTVRGRPYNHRCGVVIYPDRDIRTFFVLVSGEEWAIVPRR